MSNDTKQEELKARIESANTIAALDKLRMDVVGSKSREILTLWQEKFWERKKKYSYSEVQKLINQEVTSVLDELEKKAQIPPGYVEVKVVHLSAIQSIRSRYE